MRKIFLLSFFSITSNLLLSQNHVIDSLQNELSGAKEDVAKVNTLNELVTQFRNLNLDSAFYFSHQALALATKLNYEMGIADSKRKMGALYADKGLNNEGFKSANEALHLYEKLLVSAAPADMQLILKKKGSAYNVLGHNRINQGNYPEGLKYSFLALKVREEIGDKRGIADTEFNIGSIYMYQRNYSAALNHYRATLKIFEELGNKADLSLGYGAIGFNYSEQGNYPEAMKNFLFALGLAEEAQDNNALAETYTHLGEISKKMGNYPEALKYNFAALKKYEGTGINFQISFIHRNIGLVYMKQKKYAEASGYLAKALSFAKINGPLEYVKLSYESLAALDSTLGNYKKALEHYKLYIFYRDSALNNENTKKLVQQQMQYDFDKKETETKAQQDKKDAIAVKELQKQKLVRNGFVGGFAIVLLFAGVFLTQRNKIKEGKKRSDELLLNILPEEVAEELKSKGSADAKQFDEVTVMFTDFKNFTQISEKLSPSELVAEIDTCFIAFDNIIGRHNIEKIKTIGDAYMCAGGLPVSNTTNAMDVVNAAMEIRDFMHSRINSLSLGEGRGEVFEIRIGIHTGPVVAGIVGVKKFAYDIWGDTVNIASRMESSGEAGKVNISGSTYELVKEKFACIHRGKIEAKNKGEIDMYFVEGIN